jgi:hypothetical protein
VSDIDQTLNRREAIILRLVEIGQGLPGLGRNGDGSPSVWRNHGPTQTGVLGVPRPAFLVFDGDTRLIPEHLEQLPRFKATKMPTTMWRMDPQVMLVLANRDTVENINLDGVPVPVGPELSRWEQVIRDAITNDDVLLDLVTSNGTHFVTSLMTDLKVGRTIGAYGAWLMLVYEFRYPVFPLRS